MAEAADASIDSPRGRLGWLSATDAIILATLALFTALALLFPARVTGWAALVGNNLAVTVAYLLFAALARRARRKPLKFLLRMLPVTLAYGYLFVAMDRLQLILHGRFLDGLILRFEAAVFGVQPVLWLEQFTRPAVTEWMMFAYVFYFPMYPLLCGLIYFRHGEEPMENYFFTLGLTNILCDIGFILLPVAGPLTAIPGQFTVPLRGGLFTWLGELIRSDLQFPGGSLPSPHCAAATVMWVMAWRHCRPVFWMLLPVVLSLYVSTFFCRYHYLSDAVAGIATAGAAVFLAPRLLNGWTRWRASSRGT